MDIFYFLGSIFFLVTTVFLFVLLFYLIKILRDFSKVSSVIREMMKKIEWMSGILGISYGLLEKLAKSILKPRKVAKEGSKNK